MLKNYKTDLLKRNARKHHHLMSTLEIIRKDIWPINNHLFLNIERRIYNKVKIPIFKIKKNLNKKI